MFRRLWVFMLLALPLTASFWAQNEADIYRAVSPSVVSIEVEISESESAGGAGFLIDQDGHILTNAHVVEGAQALTVLFHDGYESQAQLIGADIQADLAVIKVDAARHRLKPVTFGDSEALVVGEAVMAIGSPLGFDATLTSGVVSGLNRELELNDGKIMRDVIQTDAALAPGNSGGPLLNQVGEVIGVNSAGYRGTALGFAIPSNLARRVAARMILDAEASATREALTTGDAHGTASAMIATANAMIADADERAAEPASDAAAGVKTATPTETSEAGEGTFSDPLKQGWQRGDGDGRWIGVGYFSNEIDEKCRRPRAQCKELTPGNEFIGVMVYAKCEDARRTRCEFNLRDFEVAGKRGIPYSAEYHFYFDTLGESLLPDAILPGSSFEGLVIFEVPRTDGDFRFGWTPSFGWNTTWFALSDRDALAATRAAEQRATATARATAQATENAQSNATRFAEVTATIQTWQTTWAMTLTPRAGRSNATRLAEVTATIQTWQTTWATTLTARAARPTKTAMPTPVGSARLASLRATIHARQTEADTTSLALVGLPTETPTPSPLLVSVDSAVNLRSGPGTTYERVGIANPGDTFAVIGYQAGNQYNWLQIRYKDGSAWIAETLTRRHN